MSHELYPTPELSSRLGRVGRSVYSQLLDRLSAYEGEVYPLHVGDTYLPPAISIAEAKELQSTQTQAHRYTPVKGTDHLISTAVEWLSTRQGVPVSKDEVIVTGGGTAGISALLATLLSPNDEVLLLAPYWPLMAGATRLHGGKPIAVPFFQEGLDLEAALLRLEEFRSPKTKVLYLNTPNNPTGETLSRHWLEALVHWAAKHGLWVISDEVYDLFSYDEPHCYTRPLDPTRVISAFSMSKAFGMAGYRCALLQGPPQVIAAVERVLTHALYSAATPAQLVAQEALSSRGLAWAQNAANLYQDIGQQVAHILQVPPPKGSTFLFIDVSHVVKKGGRFANEKEDVSTLLEACVDQGLLLAPGSAFGPYPQHLRLCFTAAEPDCVLRGVRRLEKLLE